MYYSYPSSKSPDIELLNSHLPIAISLKYLTWSMPIRTQPQSLRVDATTKLLLYAETMLDSTCENNLLPPSTISSLLSRGRRRVS